MTPSSRASAKPIDGRSAPEQQLLEFAPDALGRQIVERECRGRAPASSSSSVSSKRAANCSARSTRRVSSRKRRRIDDAQHAGARDRRGRRTDRRYSSVSGSQEIALIGEVAPPRGFVERHRRIAGHGEALVAAAGLRFAPRQRDVDAAELVDGKPGRRPRRGRMRQQRAAAVLGNAEHLDVEVLRRRARAADRARSRRRRARGRRGRGRRARSRAGLPGKVCHVHHCAVRGLRWNACHAIIYA